MLQRVLMLSATALMIGACGSEDESSAQADLSAAVMEAVEADNAAATDIVEEIEEEEAAVDPTGAPSGAYEADPTHRYITFSYSHQGYSNPYLRWREWDATLNWNAEDPTQSTVTVTIDASSIDSGVDEFDEHLRGDKFFDVANHPTITFVSTNIEQTGVNSGVITGDLTVKGVTKPVSFDATINAANLNQRAGKHKIGFSGKTTILRSEYGLGAYVPYVGDETTIVIEVEFDEVKQG